MPVRIQMEGTLYLCSDAKEWYLARKRRYHDKYLFVPFAHYGRIHEALAEYIEQKMKESDATSLRELNEQLQSAKKQVFDFMENNNEQIKSEVQKNVL